MAIMNINARGKPLTSEQIQQLQRDKGGVTPEQQALTQQLAQLPGYQQHMQTLMHASNLQERGRSYQALMDQAQAAGIVVPDDMKMDMYGAVRDKTWAEKHPKLYVTLMVAGSVGGLAGGAALAGGLGGAAGGAAGAGAGAGTGAGVGLGETGAVVGLGGSGFGTGAGLGITGAGVGLGETAATVGPASGGASVGGLGPLASTSTGVPSMAAGPVAGGAGSSVAAGLGGGGSSVLGMSPSTYELIYGAASKGLEAYGNSKNASADREAALLKAQMGVAADENTRDPFRQQMSQIRNLGQMDLMQQMKAPAPAGPTGPYARPAGVGVQPQSYAPSPEMLQWIAQMKKNVAGGQNTAPTMTNPANYGKTSVLNLSPYSPPPVTDQPPATSPTGTSALTLEQMLALAKKQQQDPSLNRWTSNV